MNLKLKTLQGSTIARRPELLEAWNALRSYKNQTTITAVCPTCHHTLSVRHEPRYKSVVVTCPEGCVEVWESAEAVNAG